MRLFLPSLALFQYSSALAVVDQYIAKESPVAKAGLLANIGSKGSRAPGTLPGVVVASPSTQDPNYFFTWTRDSSLVFKTLIDQFTRGEDDSLRGLIDDFVAAEAVLQQVPNPSGNLSTDGLGEPKFYVNLTAYEGPWGRPQRDGPALRSTALITYANWLIENDETSHVRNKIWPILKLDLDYVATKWNISGFDLWEEVSSSSFFTSAVQHRALREGVVLAKKLDQTNIIKDWSAQADNILCFLQSYWNPSGSHITSNTLHGRTGIDANSALASIHTFDADAGCDAATFQPCSDKALASLKVYVDAFRSIYPINKGIPPNGSVATGRYAEDVYYNGNPWYITTAAVAEQLYDSLIVWEAQCSITITDISLPFFQQFLPSTKPGVHPSSARTYATLIQAIRQYADGFLAINAQYTPEDGSLSEQYSKETGAPTSAVHLTWSYASALTAFAARKGIKPARWGAKGLKIPAVCHSNRPLVVQVTFNVVAETVSGEKIFVTGSIDEMMNWSPDNAVPLSVVGSKWSVTVNITASTSFEYKYIRKNGGSVTWESDPNLRAVTPATGKLVTDDTWR